MRALFLASTALLVVTAAPALACGMMQQAAGASSSTSQAAQSSSMMCGTPSAAQAQPQMLSNRLMLHSGLLSGDRSAERNSVLVQSGGRFVSEA